MKYFIVTLLMLMSFPAFAQYYNQQQDSSLYNIQAIQEQQRRMQEIQQMQAQQQQLEYQRQALEMQHQQQSQYTVYGQ